MTWSRTEETRSSIGIWVPMVPMASVREPTRVTKDASGAPRNASSQSCAYAATAWHDAATNPPSSDVTGSSKAPMKLAERPLRTWTTTASGIVLLAKVFCLPVGIDMMNPRTKAEAA